MNRRACRRCGGTGNEPTANDLRQLGLAARMERLKREITLRSAAERIGATESYLSYLECGRFGWSGNKARAYLKLLGIRL